MSEMYVRAQMILVNEYTLGQGDVTRNRVPNLRGMLEVYVKAMTNSSQLRIKPPFHYRNMPASVEPPEFEPLRKLTHRIDLALFGYMGCVEEYLMGPTAEFPTLQRLCLDKLSYTNFLLGNNQGKRYWVDTSEKYEPSKIQKLYAEFCHDRIDRGPGYEEARLLAPEALNLLYDMLGTRKYFGTQKFTFNPYKIINSMSLDSGSGIRPGPTSIEVAEDVTASVIGKKTEQISLAMTQLETWYEQTFNFKRRIHIPNYNVMKIKSERRFSYGGSATACADLEDKAREFFINGLLQQLTSEFASGFRMKLERGNVINVGRRWWYGGAWEFARFLNFDMLGMTWHEGDFKAYDKHVVDWLLMLYMANNRVYYDLKNMTDQEKYVFLRLHEEIIFNMVCKVTCHITGAWRIINGIMWSGGKETSHGDSWITLFVFCLFLVYQIKKNPFYAKRIRMLIQMGFIRLGTYGDDHLFCAPETVAHLICEKEFQRVAFLLVGMVIQEPMTHTNFITTFSPVSGELIQVGPKFLKRYFIKSSDPELAPILPFKPTHQTVCRLLLAYKTHWFTLVLAAIGQVWDTMGTNPVAYKITKKIYNFARQKDVRTPIQIYDDLVQSGSNASYLRGLLKKSGMTAEEMFSHFPSRQQIMERHVYNEIKANYTWTPERINQYTKCEEEDL